MNCDKRHPFCLCESSTELLGNTQCFSTGDSVWRCEKEIQQHWVDHLNILYNIKRWLTTLSFWATPCLQHCCSSNTLKLHMGGISWNNTVKKSQTHRTPEIVEHIMEQHWAATEICSLYFAVFSNELGKVVWVALYSVSWGSAVWIGCSRRSWFWLISPFSPRDTIQCILYIRGTAGI